MNTLTKISTLMTTELVKIMHSTSLGEAKKTVGRTRHSPLAGSWSNG